MVYFCSFLSGFFCIIAVSGILGFEVFEEFCFLRKEFIVVDVFIIIYSRAAENGGVDLVESESSLF